MKAARVTYSAGPNEVHVTLSESEARQLQTDLMVVRNALRACMPDSAEMFCERDALSRLLLLSAHLDTSIAR